ncbi:ATP-binding protein [Photorhabdus akhurstii]|uniref:ATP-binding protein n=1 Tax=Photorhabdus akhurstii TaxID=171438 RepID=UPI00370399E4
MNSFQPLKSCAKIELMENPTVADALLDRLIHNAHRLELTGESQRKKSLAEAAEVS